MKRQYPLLLQDDILGLRAPEPCDTDAYQALRNDLGSVANLIGYVRGLPQNKIAEWIANIDNKIALTLTAVLLSDHRPVGYVHVGDIEPMGATCHIGLAIFVPADRGKGYGGRVLRLTLNYLRDWLKIRKVSLRVLVDNHAAISLYRQFGFEVEGTLKDQYFIDGRYRSVLLMSKFLDAVQ